MYKGLLTLGLDGNKKSPEIQLYNNTEAQAKDFAQAVNACGAGVWFWVKGWLIAVSKTANGER
jgi:hypothetical protein